MPTVARLIHTRLTLWPVMVLCTRSCWTAFGEELDVRDRHFLKKAVLGKAVVDNSWGRGLPHVCLGAQCNPIARFLARELGRIGRCASFKVEFAKCPLPNRASRKAQGACHPLTDRTGIMAPRQAFCKVANVASWQP